MIFRRDIQILRGFAVLIVVLNHANIGLLKAGYLGVDIFFVISGYLITGIVKKAISKGDFSFTEFYFRRAKRILPAAYVVLIFTLLLSVKFLSANELKDFSKQVIGAVTFTENIVLWKQTGYFEGSSALKPLLHIWSLSLEEQYYFFLPAFMVFVPSRFWLIGVRLIFLSSLVMCIILVPLKPSASFYLFPTRAWELAIGSFATLYPWNLSIKAKSAISLLFWPSVFALFFIPIIPLNRLYPFLQGVAHPGIDALIVCISTAIVILRQHKIFNNKFFVFIIFAKIGDFSYSLYLVHWPIFAFINNIYIVEPSIGVHLAALALAFCLGFLLYRFVELPVRRFQIKASYKLAGIAIAVSVALMILPSVFIKRYVPVIENTQVQNLTNKFGETCDYSDNRENFTPKPECQNSNQPTFLVWGDSFAMHLTPGIVATVNAGVVQATRSNCGPFLNIAPMDNASYNRSWAEQCLKFNQTVFNYLAKTPSIEVVVISSPFGHFLEPFDGTDRLWRILGIFDGQLLEKTPSISTAVEAMQQTIEKLRALGKRVIVFAPPPYSGYDTRRCLERKVAELYTIGSCEISIDDYYKKSATVSNFLKKLKIN